MKAGRGLSRQREGRRGGKSRLGGIHDPDQWRRPSLYPIPLHVPGGLQRLHRLESVN